MLAVYTAQATDKCRRTYAEAGLTSEQISALRQARQTHSVEVLRNKEGRVVVILGEGTFKEGASTGAPGDLSFLMNSKETGHHQDQAGHNSGQAMMDAFPVRLIEGYPGGVFWKAYITFAHALEGLGKGRAQPSSIALAKTHAKKSGGTAKNIPLEDGFEPTGTETASVWAYPTLMLGPKFAPLVALGAFTASSFEGGMAWVLGAGFAWSAATMAKWIYLPELGESLRHRRDEYMTGTILNHLNEHPEDKAVMVVVGRNHIYGIRERLRKEGFEMQSWQETNDGRVLDGN